MDIKDNPPQYANKPVILVHASTEAKVLDGDLVKHPYMYYCAPYPYLKPQEKSYPDIPRVPCPVCYTLKGK